MMKPQRLHFDATTNDLIFNNRTSGELILWLNLHGRPLSRNVSRAMIPR